MKTYWNYAVLKQFKKNIYKFCLTHEDYLGDGALEYYETVRRIDYSTGMAVEVQVADQGEGLSSTVRMKKERNRYLLPVCFEQELPVKVVRSFDCQIKPSDKTVYKYVTQVTSARIPQREPDQSFYDFMQTFNPVEHTSMQDCMFLKLLAVASQYKSVKCAVCGEPSSGKNSNFMVLHHLFDNSPRVSSPTPARLYQVVSCNDVIVIDELTSVKSEHVREIEGMILQLGDNSTEYIKHSRSVGRQLNEADLLKKSLIFTYNRKVDIGKKSTFFDDKWNNPAAFQSRYPQFYVQGVVIGSPQIYSQSELQELLEKYDKEIKQLSSNLSYWRTNMHKHLHNWDRGMLQLKGRHVTNIAGLLDTLDAYSRTQEEFDDWMIYLNNSVLLYKQMLESGEIQEPEPKVTVKVSKMNKDQGLLDIDEDIL